MYAAMAAAYGISADQAIDATGSTGVLEAAAIGVHDDRSGEAVKVVVVRKDPALTEGDLLAHCRQHLTGYKMPRVVEFRSEPLPKTNIGKILRRELRDGAAAMDAGPAAAGRG